MRLSGRNQLTGVITKVNLGGDGDGAGAVGRSD
jgi:hypothetical protein